MRKNIRIFGLILLAVLVTLACQISAGTAIPTAVPATEDRNILNTQVALAMTQTAFKSLSSAPTATHSLQNQNPGLVKTQEALAMTQTAMSIVPTHTQQVPPTEQDLQTLINSANILVYEDVAGDPFYLPYVKRALKSVGGHQEYVADAMGTFMNKMNSGTSWDLIIVASELRTAISGDYWTVLKDQVDNGAALISEIWYLDKINAGKIAPFLNECGVALQSDWQGASVYNPIDYGMYWVDPSNPIFNTPNQLNRFGSSLTDPAWKYGDIGDLLEVTDSSKAKILASHEAEHESDYGLITSCMDGRVIFQTFSSHNYPTNEMIALWENYINYTLTNHFLISH